MRKMLNNDTSLKILSLVIAILCWVFIVIITNPQIEVTVSGIPITLSDHQSIKSEGYIVSTEMDKTVDIKLRGTRQMLANINKDNVLAYIDLSGCTNKGSYKLPISVKLPYEEVKVVSKSVYNLTVAVDNYITRYFKLEYAHKGSLRNQNYSVNSTELDEKTIKVSGSEDIIKTIEKAVVEIDLNRESSDFSGNAPVVFLNSSGNEILSESIETETNEIAYKCVVYEEKSVEVTPSFEHTASGIKHTVTDHPKVTIIGPAAEVDKINSIATKNIVFNADDLPKEITANLNIPKNIKIEEDISKVNILVEKK